MGIEESKRLAWELVNEFVACCSHHDCPLTDEQAKQAQKLQAWIAQTLQRVSK